MESHTSFIRAVTPVTQTYSFQTFFRGKSWVLPQPNHEYHADGTHFFVYKVKDQDQNFFPNSTLQVILEEARKTYLRYGNMPLIDEYDMKSSIYLTRVVYPLVHHGTSFLVEEWSSVRFVPVGGSPCATEDLTSCVYHGKPLQDSFQDFSKSVSISRICKITPHILGESASVPVWMIPEKNKYTGLSFALMNSLYLQDNHRAGRSVRLFTALAKPELFEKVLTFTGTFGTFHFPFVPIRDAISLSHPTQFRMQRNVLAYHHPGYFLHLHTLHRLFGKLIQLERLSESTWQKYFGTPLTYSQFDAVFFEYSYHQLLPHFLGLSQLLATPHWIENSRMHGTELRSLVDICVPDAVELFVCTYEEWKNATEIVLQYSPDFFS